MRLSTIAVVGALASLVTACDVNRTSDPGAGHVNNQSGKLVPDDNDPPATGGGGPWRGSSMGYDVVGINGESDQDRRALLAKVAESHISFVRLTMDWMDAQPDHWEDTTYDAGWKARMDSTIQAIQDYGLTPVVTLETTPGWAQEVDPSMWNRHRPPGPGFWWYWQRFAWDMVRRYPSVTYWAIDNEPNSKPPEILAPHYTSAACPTGDWMASYDAAFRYAADVIQPAGKIIVAPTLGIGGNPACGEDEGQSLLRFIQMLGYRMRPSTDIYAVNWYGNGANFTSWMTRYDQVLTESGENNDVWVIEHAHDRDEKTKANWQAYTATGFYSLLFTNQLPARVKKMFKWNLYSDYDFRVLDVNYYPFSIAERPGFQCLKEIASNYSWNQLDYVCTHWDESNP